MVKREDQIDATIDMLQRDTRRFRGLRNPMSKRRPANELPQELYDDDWWKANHRIFRLQASEDHFEWKTLTVVSR
jgi:hypothetical protein